MADEYQSGICSGSWWNSNRNSGFNGSSSPCSAAITDIGFGWGSETAAARSCEESASSVSGSSSIIFPDAQKVSVSDSLSGSGVLIDSTLQMAGFGVPSSMDWSQALLRSSGRAERNFHSMLQEDLSLRSNFRQDIQLDSKFSTAAEDSPINAFKQLNQSFSLDQNLLNSGNSSGDCPMTCQSLPTNSFPMDSAPYGGPPAYLHGLFEADHQPQQSPYESRSINYPSQLNYRMNSNEFPTSWPKNPQFLKSSPPKPQPSNQLHFSNNGQFWNPSAGAMSDVGSSFYPSSNAYFLTHAFEEKPNCSSLAVKPNAEEVRDSCSATKKSSTEPAFKRPRIEAPSPLPTFKVRKEKLGDRITALQQLVSPFGKTDTASVLLEAIEYIKFLHDQVSILSTAYMKNGAPMQHQQNSDKSMDAEGPKQDLRSRGLCLVPISSTYPVTNESAVDYWSPTYGGSFR